MDQKKQGLEPHLPTSQPTGARRQGVVPGKARRSSRCGVAAKVTATLRPEGSQASSCTRPPAASPELGSDTWAPRGEWRRPGPYLGQVQHGYSSLGALPEGEAVEHRLVGGGEQ